MNCTYQIPGDSYHLRVKKSDTQKGYVEYQCRKCGATYQLPQPVKDHFICNTEFPTLEEVQRNLPKDFLAVNRRGFLVIFYKGLLITAFAKMREAGAKGFSKFVNGSDTAFYAPAMEFPNHLL